MTPQQNAANVEMSSARIVVEWGFGLIVNQFGYGEKKKSTTEWSITSWSILYSICPSYKLSNMPSTTQPNQ